MRFKADFRGEQLERYHRVKRATGVLFSPLEFAIAVLDIAPPDLAWLVQSALERRGPKTGRSALGNDDPPHDVTVKGAE